MSAGCGKVMLRNNGLDGTNEKAPGINLHSRRFIRGLAHIEERCFRRVVIRRALVVDEDYACSKRVHERLRHEPARCQRCLRAADESHVRRHFLASSDAFFPIIHELCHIRGRWCSLQQSNVADRQKAYCPSRLFRATLHDGGGFCDACGSKGDANIGTLSAPHALSRLVGFQRTASKEALFRTSGMPKPSISGTSE